jgi:hypothetical protein
MSLELTSIRSTPDKGRAFRPSLFGDGIAIGASHLLQQLPQRILERLAILLRRFVLVQPRPLHRAGERQGEKLPQEEGFYGGSGRS